jgi:hypothetical protein
VTLIALPDDCSPERASAPSAKARPIAHDTETETETENEIKPMKPKVASTAPNPRPLAAKPLVTTKRAAAGPVEAKPAFTTSGERRTPTQKAPPKAATPRPKAGKTVPVEPALTTVEVKRDVGFGNTLFIRGQGDGLSWDQGIPLRCVDASTWIWTTTEVKDQLVFKLLLNDQTWSQGGNQIAPAGKKTEVAPVF